jgi:hypothetical protein
MKARPPDMAGRAFDASQGHPSLVDRRTDD